MRQNNENPIAKTVPFPMNSSGHRDYIAFWIREKHKYGREVRPLRIAPWQTGTDERQR